VPCHGLFFQDDFGNVVNGVVNISTLNLARERRPEFPGMFMIMLFLVVTLTLTLLAVSVVMWDMDPGRDSIVYRMTDQPRLKLE
jgi:renin receptor